MKETYTYPVILSKEEDGYLVTLPDFPGQMTDAGSEAEAVRAAQDLLALLICDNEDQGQENPVPSDPGAIEVEEGEKLIYVNLWMPYFRQVQKVVYVKKTLTLPKWLDDMAKEKKVNFSAILTKGVKEELGIGTDDTV